MKNCQKYSWLIGILFVLLLSTAVHASLREPYVILEAEHGDLIGQNLMEVGGNDLGYVTVKQGYQNDMLSLMLDVFNEESYEFWIRVRGRNSAKLALYDSNRELYYETFQGKNDKWHWIKLKKIDTLMRGRYYVALSDFTGYLEIDKVIVKTKNKNEKQSNETVQYGIQSTTLSEPVLPNESPWVKQGLNPFASLLQNGNEFVSTTSGVLTIAATDFVVPGRGGLDLVFSRYYNSKTQHGDKREETYLVGDWDFGFPRIVDNMVYFPNGSQIDIYDDEIHPYDEYVGNDKKIIYPNSKVRYFKLEKYEKYTGEILNHPQYKLDHYKLYLADGSYYYFDASGKIEYIYGKNSLNKIHFEYENDQLSTITDTVDRVYKIERSSDQIKIVRQEDNKTLVAYGLGNNGNEIQTVTDAMQRVTSYDYWTYGIVHIAYPSGKSSSYSYEEKYANGTIFYWITNQSIYDHDKDGNSILVERKEFKYNFINEEFRNIRHIEVVQFDEDNAEQFRTIYQTNDKGMVVRTKTITPDKVVRTVYTEYDDSSKISKESTYYGNIYEFSFDQHITNPLVNTDKLNKEDQWLLYKEKWIYDSYGNQIYYKDPQDYETMTSFVNTEYSSFCGYESLTSNSFYNNSALTNSEIHNLPAGQLKVRKYLDTERKNIDASEVYYLYNASGELIESKTPYVDVYGTKNWVKTKYLDYDHGNCGKQIFDAEGLEPITVKYEYDPIYSNAYLTKQTQYISKNLVDDNGVSQNITAEVTTRYEYDFLTGNRTKIFDPRGNVVEYIYDDLGRITKVIYPKLATETEAAYEEVVYEDENNLVKVYDAERKSLVIQHFDGLGRTSKVEKYLDLDGNTLDSEVSSTYNWQNQVKSTFDENGIETKYEYDIFGRQKRVATVEGSKETELYSIDYDDLKSEITTTTIKNQKTLQQIEFKDKKGQIVQKTLENNGEKLNYYYEYDGYGNVIKTTDAKSQEMGYVYNHLGQLIQVKYPDDLGHIHVDQLDLFVKNYYDRKGNLAKTIDRKNQTIQYDYNEYNQLITVDLPNPEDIEYFYNELGQLIFVKQGNKFNKFYSYDKRGRLTKEKLTVDPASTQKEYVTDYAYNKNNAVTDITYPKTAGILHYDYNSLNQINTVKWRGSQIVQLVDYNKTGHLEKLTYGNDVKGQFHYDYINGQYVPDNITYRGLTRTLGVYDYRYDEFGNIVRANNHQYEYDDLNQLIGWSFLSHNDQVLLGEEKIWEKEMTDQQDLMLYNTLVTNDTLQLGVKPGQEIVNVGRLLTTSEVASSLNLETNLNEGYILHRNRYVYNETFKDKDKLTTTANVNEVTGEVTLPENQSTNLWVSVFSKDFNPPFQLDKSDSDDITTFLNSASLNASYSGFKYEINDDMWKPPINSTSWQKVPTELHISKDQLKDVTKLELEVTSSLLNSWKLWGGWGNWTMWLKFTIEGKPINEFMYFRTNAKESEDQTKTLVVNLDDYGLVNRSNGLTIRTYWVVNEWGTGSTKGGIIKTIKATAKAKQVYPTDPKKVTSLQVNIEEDNTYKFVADDLRNSYGVVEYKLKKSTSTTSQTLKNNDIKTLSSGTYNLSIGVSSLNDQITPTVSRVQFLKEVKYKSSAVVRLKTLDLLENCKEIALEYNHTLPSGTRIEYRVSNDNGTTWKVPVYESGIKKHVARFTSAGNKVIVQATLYSNAKQNLTPTLSNIKVTVLDSGEYSSSGKVITKTIHVPKPSTMLILDLHAKKNYGSLNVSLNVNGEVINGVATAIEDLVGDGYDVENGGSSGDVGGTTLEQKAQTLLDEINIFNIPVQHYYYKFVLPEYQTTAFDATLTIELKASSNRLFTPNVYSYILFFNELSYYTSGSFNSNDSILTEKPYTFDKIRLDVVGETPTNTSVSYNAYDFGSGSIPVTPGVKTSLGLDTNSLKIEGIVSTGNVGQTPKISKMTVTAIGEIPLKNDLETSEVELVNLNGGSGLSISFDHKVGDVSWAIASNNGIVNHEINKTSVFDATKLPIIQVWVKPLKPNSSISFSTWDVVDGRNELITNDVNGDSLFKEGEDLVLDRWNLVLLDLSKTNGGGIAKDARGLSFIVEGYLNEVLIDGVNSLPLNHANYLYDKAGNRTYYTENGLTTTYEYEIGSNRLKRRYNLYEDINYTYDDNGNLISQEVTSYGDYYKFDYVFNELNQLVEVKKNNASIANYYYDQNGLRYKKVDKVANKTTIYVYGTGTEPIYEEIYSNSDLQTPLSKVSYLSMGGKRIASAEGSAVSYYFTDHLGSTRIVMDDSGNCTYSRYKPFGSDFVGSSERYKFTGKEDDGGTGLYYYNARYYDPVIGRFASEDTAKDGVNWYVYCRSNPLKYVDLNGQETTLLQGYFTIGDVSAILNLLGKPVTYGGGTAQVISDGNSILGQEIVLGAAKYAKGFTYIGLGITIYNELLTKYEDFRVILDVEKRNEFISKGNDLLSKWSKELEKMDPSWDAYIAFKILYEELKGEIRANILAKEKEAIVKEYEDEWAKKWQNIMMGEVL